MTRQERIEFVVGGIQGAAQTVEEGFRHRPKGSRQKVADLLRDLAAELQSVANGGRR